MESCSNQKRGLRFFKVATLCLDDSFAHLAFSQPISPGMLFQPSWRSSHICWTLDGCFSFTLRSDSSQTISIGLRLGRPGHLMQHSITLLLGQIALTQPGSGLDHCPVEKQMIVGLSFVFQQDNDLTHLQVVYGLFGLEGEWWSAAYVGTPSIRIQWLNTMTVQRWHHGNGWLLWTI